MWKKYSFVLILFVPFLFSACYKESAVIADSNELIFNFQMDESVEKMVNKTPGRKIYLNPDPFLYFNGNSYVTNSMSTRGQGSLKYRRKSFSVNLGNTISFDEFPEKEFEKFKLISMVYDYTYIENKLAHFFLKKVDLWPLTTFLTEVKLNGNHNGLYLFIEDPENYFFTNKNAEVFIRRGYDAALSKTELNTKNATKSKSFYKSEFKSLYKIIVDYQGDELYNKLQEKLNLQNYFRKMAIDFILQNADNTDEVFFYGRTINNEVYFDIQPWDYDDLFGSQPHEVGNSGDVGTAFGKRNYDTYNDVIEVLEGKLVFTIEDDLDYIITEDEFLYQKYLIELDYVLAQFTPTDIEQMFDVLKERLDPFYAIPEVIAQSEYDKSSTSFEKFNNNLVDKEKFLIERIDWIKVELSKQKTNE
ncbi:MAG: CotH kinase family protein [Prolixibacteraceae bacterium]|jgi:hypothetical protein|nr:CotH kinase family protein [Prolixibacteraceae bacterium]